MTSTESQIELDLLAKLGDLKYRYRPDIRDRAALEASSRQRPYSSATSSSCRSLPSIIDYDSIMGLIARMTAQKPGKPTMSRDDLIGLIQADAKFIDEREDIAETIRSLPLGQALVEDLTPLLHKLAQGREISGLSAYEQ